MIKYIMALAVAIGLASPAQATSVSYYTNGVLVTCESNTTFDQDQAWVAHLGLTNQSTWDAAIAYHQQRASGGMTMSDAALCWMYAIYNMDIEELADRYEQALGYVPSGFNNAGSDIGSILFYISTDFTGVVRVPSSFMDTLNAEDPTFVGQFQKSWEIANGLNNPLPHFTGTYATNKAFLEQWVEDWDDLDSSQRRNKVYDFEADITEYY